MRRAARTPSRAATIGWPRVADDRRRAIAHAKPRRPSARERLLVALLRRLSHRDGRDLLVIAAALMSRERTIDRAGRGLRGGASLGYMRARRGLMVSVLSLLIPIALSAVIVFIVSSVIHMVTPLHKNDFRSGAERRRA